MSREIKTLEACKVPRYLHRARELLNFYTEDYNLLFGIFIFSAVYLWTLLFFHIHLSSIETDLSSLSKQFVQFVWRRNSLGNLSKYTKAPQLSHSVRRPIGVNVMKPGWTPEPKCVSVDLGSLIPCRRLFSASEFHIPTGVLLNLITSSLIHTSSTVKCTHTWASEQDQLTITVENLKSVGSAVSDIFLILREGKANRTAYIWTVKFKNSSLLH